jgi:hypothetical protein
MVCGRGRVRLHRRDIPNGAGRGRSCHVWGGLRSVRPDDTDLLPAIALLAAGTILATGFGRVLYQKSLTVSDNNNGFVSIFFLLTPAFTCLLSLGMSRWISELKFAVGPLFFLGLALIAAPILVFLWQSRQPRPDRSATREINLAPNVPASDLVWSYVPRSSRVPGRPMSLDPK